MTFKSGLYVLPRLKGVKLLLPKKITLCEVGLRDGLQNEPVILSLDQKVRLVQALLAAGFKVIELGSFMHPKAVPQMAETDALFQRIKRPEHVEFRALVANKRGVERAIQSGCKKVKLNVSASRGHNLANLNMTPEESVSNFKTMADLARNHGLTVSGSISMPFGSPWEGKIPISEIEVIVEAYQKVGINEISLSDASGMAVPSQVFQITDQLQSAYPGIIWWLHFHNTRGLGMANMLAAMQAGITRFDTSIGGLGGCPFVPGAVGNLSTEDVVHMLDEMKIETGLDLEQLLNAARSLSEMVSHPVDSYVLKAGRSADLIKCLK